MQQDPIYSTIEGQPRPSIRATSSLILLATAGLWLSALLDFTPTALGGYLVANAAYYLPFVLAPAAAYLLRRPEVRASARLNPMPLGPTLSVVLLGLLSVYVSSALTAAWQLLMDAVGLPAIGAAPAIENTRELTLAVIALAALPAACEELLFRGLVLPAWESRGTRFAIGVTAVLFALLHGNITGMPAYLLVGAVSGFLVFAVDSLYAGIIYHTVYNAACLIIPFLAANQAADEALSGASLLPALLFQTLMVTAMMALLLLSLFARAKRDARLVIPRIRRPLDGGDKIALTAAALAMLASAVVVAAFSVASMGGAA